MHILMLTFNLNTKTELVTAQLELPQLFEFFCSFRYLLLQSIVKTVVGPKFFRTKGSPCAVLYIQVRRQAVLLSFFPYTLTVWFSLLLLIFSGPTVPVNAMSFSHTR